MERICPAHRKDDWEKLSHTAGNKIVSIYAEIHVGDSKIKRIMLELDLNYLHKLELDCQNSSDSIEKEKKIWSEEKVVNKLSQIRQFHRSLLGSYGGHSEKNAWNSTTTKKL